MTDLTAERNYFSNLLSENDQFHCLVLILPADKISEMSKEINKMKQILQRAHGESSSCHLDFLHSFICNNMSI